VGTSQSITDHRPPARGGSVVFVKELTVRVRRRVLNHFLALDASDRLLRFGTAVSDEVITRYVDHLDFVRDTLFGVYDWRLRLLGVGHLAFAPRDQTVDSRVTAKARVAEFGVSVAASARGRGVGSALFERAAMHCRNADVDTLYMHCLSSNKTMMHIAKKAGMEIHRDYGEADAYLKLPPAGPGSVMQEALKEQAATLDYTLKVNARAVLKWLDRMTGRKRR